MKLPFLFIIPFLASQTLLASSFSNMEKQFDSIIVRFGFGTPPRNASLVDFDCNFAWLLGTESRDSTEHLLFVYSKSHRRWLQITQVSTNGAKFGKSSDAPRPASWNFTELASKKFVQVPIPNPGSSHSPDQISFDRNRDTFVLYFDSAFHAKEFEITSLLIRNRDLSAAFDYYFKPKAEQGAAANP